jgi:hypothetical protein
MNVLKAREILELPENFSETLLKKQYHLLARRYHPDKSPGTADIFIKISEAYEFLCKTPTEPNFQEEIISKIFKSFTVNLTKPPSQLKQTVTLTAKEYLTGCIRKLPTRKSCTCEKKICTVCSLIGFCNNCMGDGYTQNCENCNNGTVLTNIFIGPRKTSTTHPLFGVITIKLEKPYFIKEDQLYCYFDISLKESLTGFEKIFKDPFGVEHNICINTVVKTNDGYRVKNVILVFNVIYPKKLSDSVIAHLKMIDF